MALPLFRRGAKGDKFVQYLAEKVLPQAAALSESAGTVFGRHASSSDACAPLARAG